jgi:thiosulfate/3-mercaptopyruvate sulfurtransferase
MHKTLIDPSTLAPHVNDPNWVVIDCRFDLANPEKGEELYREAHIPGARYAHLDRHLSGPKTGKNGRHPLPDSDVIGATSAILGILAGHASRRLRRDSRHVCARLWWMLRWMGHDAVAVLDGGIARWQHEGHPVRGGVETSTKGNFKGSPRPGWRLTVDDVMKDLGNPLRLLVDSRTPSGIAASTRRSTRSADTSPARRTISSSRIWPRTRPSRTPTTSRPSGSADHQGPRSPRTSSSTAAQRHGLP